MSAQRKGKEGDLGILLQGQVQRMASPRKCSQSVGLPLRRKAPPPAASTGMSDTGRGLPQTLRGRGTWAWDTAEVPPCGPSCKALFRVPFLQDDLMSFVHSSTASSGAHGAPHPVAVNEWCGPHRHAPSGVPGFGSRRDVPRFDLPEGPRP